MGRSSLVERTAEILAKDGFDLVGATSVADHDALARSDLAIGPRFPWARSVLVVGNGGGGLWRRVVRDAEKRGGIASLDDPIDDFVERAAEHGLRPILEEGGGRFRFVFAHRFAEDPLSFVDLARAAGLGVPSLLRVLIHPRFGPWMALRFAVLLDEEVEAEGPAVGFDPCPTCVERACVAACPAGAVRDPQGWDVDACVDHRRRTGNCETRCHARFDCVIGREHRYPDEALAHHHRRAWQMMRGSTGL